MIGDRVSKITTSLDEDVRWWFDEIDRGIKYRKPFMEKYKFNKEFENMNQWTMDSGKLRKGTGDETTINKVGSFLRTRRAVLGYDNPRVVYTPKSSDGYDPINVPVVGPDGTPKLDPVTGQVMVRQVLKYKAREDMVNDIISSPMFGLSATIDRLCKSGDIAFGVLKTGFGPTFETKPEREGSQEIELKDGKFDLSRMVKNPITGHPVIDGNEIVSKELIPSWESWFIDWVNPERIIVDPDCENDTQQLRWIVEEEVRPLADVKADDLFKNTKDLKATGTEPDDTSLDDYTEESIKERHKRVRLFHIWDRVNDKYMVLADGHGKWLRNGKTPSGVYEDPYGFYRNNETSGQWYQRALMTDLIPIAMQYNIVSQMLLKDAKRSIRKIFVDDRMMDTIDATKFRSDEDMALIGVNTRHRGIGDMILPFSPPSTSMDLYTALQRIDNDFYEVAGMPPEAVGTPKSKTATQANKMDEYHGARIDIDRKKLAACLQVIFKKFDDSIEANMTQPRAVKLRGTDGQVFTGMVDPAEIAGDFDVAIDVQDMSPRNGTMEAAQWVQAAQVVGTAPWLVSDEILAREYCHKFGIKNELYIKKLSETAQMIMQQQATANQPQGTSPESEPPTSEAQAVQQLGAGGQVPRMSSAP